MAAQQAAKQQEQPNPEPPAAPQPEPLPEPEPPANLPKPTASILDDDIPDFSAGLDPASLEAARKADEKAPPRSTDEFQRAASQLFEDDEDDGEDEEPTITFPGCSKAKPAVLRPLAAKQEPKQDAIHNRSLAMIERAERRHRRKAIAAVAVIALLVLVGAAVLLGLTRGCTVKAPAYKNYGTEQFDTQAQAYLKSAAAENEKIIGYLAFPGQNGQLVYSGSQPGDGAAISGTNYLNASMPSNTVLSCADASLASLTDQTNFSQNAEFTLYLSDVTYHFRAVAVYNTDAAGTENAFTPASYGELSDYYSYAEFSQSIKERSLFDTGNTPGDKETFLTLMSTGGTNGTFVCVTRCSVAGSGPVSLGQYRIILSADTASEVRQMLSQKAQIILDAAKVSAASGGNSEPKQGSGRRVRGGFAPEARCGYRNPTLSSILATQMPCRSRRSGA